MARAHPSVSRIEAPFRHPTRCRCKSIKEDLRIILSPFEEPGRMDPPYFGGRMKVVLTDMGRLVHLCRAVRRIAKLLRKTG
jgi:hypothetical protein